MKIVLACLILSLVSFTSNDNNFSLPSVIVEDINGNEVNTSTFSNNGKPLVITFWAAWNTLSKRQLNTMHEEYQYWQEDTGTKIIVVSVDDDQTKHKVKPYAEGKEWDFEVYFDSGKDFMREMGAIEVPHTLLFDGNGKLVWQQNGYSDGDEDELFEQIQKYSN